VKILKITKAANYRIFRDFDWPDTLPEFARFNVIYGWNGSGKTSLSRVNASSTFGAIGSVPSCRTSVVL